MRSKQNPLLSRLARQWHEQVWPSINQYIMASLTQDFSSFEPTQPNRYGTLALIVVAHMALFVLLRSGLLPQVAQTLPQQMLH